MIFSLALSFVLAITWFVFNIAIVIPLAILLFYTFNSLLPIIAAVEDIHPPVCEPLEQGKVAKQYVEREKSGLESRPVSFSIKSMVRLLYSIEGYLSITRGLIFYLIWISCRVALLILALKTSTIIQFFLAQFIFPLFLSHAHTVWVHTVLSYPNPDTFFKRNLPTKIVFKAVTPAMFLLLVAEAITQHIMLYVYHNVGEPHEYWFPTGGSMQKAGLMCLVLATLTFILIIPAHLLLVRIQASILSADEQPIVSLDPALSSGQYERGYMTLTEAWKSLRWVSLVNLGSIYLKIFIITAGTVATVGLMDFRWFNFYIYVGRMET